MNSSHLLAWLTCLLLAFVACLLGAFNLGRQRLLERDIDRVEAKMEAKMEAVPGHEEAGLQAADVQRIRKALAELRTEIDQIKAAESRMPAEMGPRLQKLETLVKALQEALAEDAGQ